MDNPAIFRIMIVDDDPDIRIIIEDVLRDKYEVCHAVNGKDALDKIDDYEPDFIIMDVQMPMMDGFDCCEAIRKRPDFRDVQVMFLSAHGSRDNIAKSYQSGANLFLSKPIEPERLLRNVDLFFEKNSIEPKPKKLTMRQIELYERTGKAGTHPVASSSARPTRPETPLERPARRGEWKPGKDSADIPSGKPAEVGANPYASQAVVSRLMVVEDDKDLARQMMMALAEKYEVVYAGDGLSALDKIPSYQPDILLLDVMLPRMNGYQLCQSIRGNPAFVHTPVVFVTAKASSRERGYALRSGADAVLAKPFEIDELMQTVANIEQRSGYQIRPKRMTLEEIKILESRPRGSRPPSEGRFDRQGRVD